jgi:hypothetical protein
MVSADVVRRLLAVHGEVRPQPVTDWCGDFPLPAAVEQFYRDVGPDNISIRTHGDFYCLPSLAELWQFQAGYHWHGLTGEAIENWKDDWLVVGDQGGDPFIFSRSTESISFAWHGQGEWDAGEMFPDLNTMAACLAQLGAIVLEAGSDFRSSNYLIRPKNRAKAATRLEELLGSKVGAEIVLGMFGWR